MVRSENTPHNAAGNNDIGLDVAASVWDVGWGMLRAAVVLVWWAVLFPMLSVPAAAAVYAGVAYRWPAGVGVGALGVVGLLIWWIFGRRSFQRAVSGRIFRRWRRWWVYRRRWAKICALHGLTVTLDGSVLVPTLRTVRVGYVTDLVSVRMLLGQSVTAWQAQSEALTHAFGALAVQVRGVKPGEVLIEVHHGDALLDPIPITVPQTTSKVDLLRIPIGRCESGTAWTIRLLGRHLLIAGATGAGKGSIIWSLLTGLGPAIAAGVVSVRVIDPKGGMEFGPGAPLFDRFAHDTGEPMLTLLREAAQVMTERVERLRGVTRLHRTPDPARHRRDRLPDRLPDRPQDQGRGGTAPGAAAHPGTRRRSQRHRRRPGPFQGRAGDAATVPHPNRDAADRTSASGHGPWRLSAGTGRTLRSDTRVQPRRRLRRRGGNHRPPAGTGLPRHRHRHQPRRRRLPATAGAAPDTG